MVSVSDRASDKLVLHVMMNAVCVGRLPVELGQVISREPATAGSVDLMLFYNDCSQNDARHRLFRWCKLTPAIYLDCVDPVL